VQSADRSKIYTNANHLLCRRIAYIEDGVQIMSLVDGQKEGTKCDISGVSVRFSAKFIPSRSRFLFERH